MKQYLALAAVVALSGCGLHPLYAGGSKGSVAQVLAGVSVTPIEGKSGYLMRNALTDRLSASGPTRYRLDVTLDDKIQGFGVRRDDAITRERRSLRARFQLIDASRGTVLLDGTAGSDAGIDAVSSEYATIAAEDTALENLTQTVADQIVARIGLYAQRSGGQ
jgi:LPS-assembly lipoprotein